MTIDNANTEGQSDGADAAADAGGRSSAASDAVPANEEATTDADDAVDEAPRTAASSGENFSVPASAVEPAPSSLKCRFLPHGVYSVLPALFSTMAWFACLSKDGCDYARVTGPIVADITNNPGIPFVDAGLSRYREPKLNIESGEWFTDMSIPCEEYNTDIVTIDAAWQFARFAAFLSLVFGGGGALFVWFSSCFVFQRHVWRWAGYELLVATAMQALTFTWFATSLCKGNDGQDKCTLYYGARADILACILWAAAMVFIFCKYPAVKVPEAGNPQRPSEVEMSEQSEQRQMGTAMVPNDHEII